jgi:hypothetical protein
LNRNLIPKSTGGLLSQLMNSGIDPRALSGILNGALSASQNPMQFMASANRAATPKATNIPSYNDARDTAQLTNIDNSQQAYDADAAVANQDQLSQEDAAVVAQEAAQPKSKSKKAASNSDYSKPGTAATTDLQKDLIDGADNLARLDMIQKAYDDDFLTYWGQGRAAVMPKIEKLTGWNPDKEFTTKRVEFKNGIEQFFSSFRKQITGAQAAVAELDYLRNIMLNEDVSPSEYEGAFNQLKSLTTRTIGIKQKILAQGIPLTPEKLGELVDAELYREKQAEAAAQAAPKADPLGWRT